MGAVRIIVIHTLLPIKHIAKGHDPPLQIRVRGNTGIQDRCRNSVSIDMAKQDIITKIMNGLLDPSH